MLFDYKIKEENFDNNKASNSNITTDENKTDKTDEGLLSVFKEVLNESNEDKISTSFFQNKLEEKYAVEDESELLKILNTIADNCDDGDGYLSLEDFEMQEKYDEISMQLYNATAGRLGTDEEKFYEILNDENLDGKDWANIIQTYEAIYNRNLIDDIDADFSGITESGARNEIMKKIASKLLESIESGDEFTLEIACNELYASLKPTTNVEGKEVLDTNKADEFVVNLLGGDDRTTAKILNKYNQITDSDLIRDIQKNDGISKANKDLIIHRLEVINTSILSEFGNNQSPFEELNLDNYPESDQNKAWTINLLIQGLNGSLSDFQNQNNEDGNISDNYNLIKALTGLGLSSEDLISAFEDQETLVQELTKALNGESELSFEETFKKLTGVEYDEEKIIEYQELSNQYTIACVSTQNAQMFQESISTADNLEDVLNLFVSYYGDETKGKEEFLTYLREGMIPSSDDLDDINQKTVAFGGYITDIKFDDNGQLVISKISNYNYKRDGEADEIETITYDLAQTANVIRTLPKTFDENKFINLATENIEKCFNTTIETLQENYYNAKKEALGSADKLEETINSYCQSQDDFIDKLANVARGAGMAIIAVNGVITLINPPVGASNIIRAIKIMEFGNYMSLGGMFGNNALKAVDGLTSANGLSEEEAKSLIRETLTEIGYLALGSGINSIAEVARIGSIEQLTSLGLSEKAVNVLSWMAEGGVDMALSVLSDMIITGDTNLSGNALQTLMGILTGVANAKIRHLKEQRLGELEEKFLTGEYTQTDIDEYVELNFNGKRRSKKQKVDDPNVVVADKLYSGYSNGTVLNKGQEYEVAAGTSVKVGNTILSLDDLSLNPGETITIGRSGCGADYQIADNTVSASHMKITATESGYIIVDTNSTNGTMIQFSPLVLKHSDGSITIHKNISTDTYNSLFGTADGTVHSNTEQQSNGDCYLLSVLNALFENSQSRNVILNCFQETPDGKITVSLPNGQFQVDVYTAMREINANLSQYNKTSLGIAILEYVYGQERYAKALELAACGSNPYTDGFSKSIYNKLKHYSENGRSLIDADEFRSGGNSAEVFSMFGFEAEYMYDPEAMIKFLSKKSNIENYVFTISTKRTPNGGGDNYWWYKDLDLAGGHSYLAQPVLRNGQVVILIKNPWHSNEISCILTLDQLSSLGCFSGLYATKVG